MTWNEFYQALKADDVSPVYLFTGPEEYIKREALEALRKKLLPAGLETLNDITLENVSAQQITDAAETIPMMCARRLVTVRDWAPLMSGKAKNEDADVEWMQRWLKNPAQSCALIFYMRGEMDGRKKLCGILKKNAAVVQFDPLSDAELDRWCAGRLKPRGKKLSRQALNTLTYMAGRELTRLSGELDKLAAYVGDERGEITPDDVRAIVPASLEYNIFEILSGLLAGDIGKAQQIINSLLQSGQTPMAMLAMLTRQIRQMAHVKCALDAGTPLPAVQEQLKMHPYAVKQTARQVSKLSSEWLTGLFEECVEADYAVKNGRLREKDAFDALVLKIGLAVRRN